MNDAALLEADDLGLRRRSQHPGTVACRGYIRGVPSPHDAPESCIARVPIFRTLTPEQQAEVAEFTRPIRVARGEAIYQAGSGIGKLLVVHRGTVALLHRAPDGREHIVRVLGAGDVIGETTFVTGDRPDHDAIATADAELCTFDHADLARLVHRHPAIAIQMLQSVTQRMVDAERKLAGLAVSDVGSRVASYLLDLPATTDAAGRLVIRLPMPKKEIASFLGTTPETLSRRLAALADAGVIEMSGRREIILLDPDALDVRAQA